LDRVKFVKYQGTGNDFIVIDDFSASFPIEDAEFVSFLCDRHFGIGADGLVLCQESSKVDMKMRYLNSDGREADLCGNALRCLVFHMQERLFADKKHCLIESGAGIHEAYISGNKAVVSMPRPLIKKCYPKIYKYFDGYHLMAGVDHLVLITKGRSVDSLDISEIGEKLRYDPRFSPEGVNVNFVSVLPNGQVKMRTYEKGVEEETLSCGTGALAVAYLLHTTFQFDQDLPILFASGETLEYTFSQTSTGMKRIWLKGGVEKVFEGVVDHQNVNMA